MLKNTIIGVLCLFALVSCEKEGPKIMDGNVIRVNQVGYYPNEEKTATIEAEGFSKKYKLVDANDKTVWKGTALREATSAISGKVRQVVDFSEVKTPGEYTLIAGEYAQPVVISENALSELTKASMKAFYYQRTGTEITEEYAGKWTRPAGHPDTQVLVHPSAVSKGRKAGTVISSPGGWYDAGDFNKYIVNSGFSIGVMLCAYQMAPEQYACYELNIPESGNATPDFLDELLFNLKWMLTMQDPADGGVYHKLTTPSFEAFIMPTECHQPRYVVAKSTAAALDFAATMAQAARVYADYPEYADFVAQALPAAEKAYEWAVQNPKVLYLQNEMNKTYQPAITTGEYGDFKMTDEFFWASTELFFSTKKESYLVDVQKYAPSEYSLPAWPGVSALGVYEFIIQSLKKHDTIGQEGTNIARPLVINYCNNKIKDAEGSCFQSTYGNKAEDFGWGSLAENCCCLSLTHLFAYKLTNDRKYLTAALQNINYILGQNATGYCYVTGFGTKPFMNPHQRLSAADGIEEPLPGFLSGGPNPGQQDRATAPAYPSDFADESYLDDMNSYASNEIAINWNASLAAVLGWLEAELK